MILVTLINYILDDIKDDFDTYLYRKHLYDI